MIIKLKQSDIIIATYSITTIRNHAYQYYYFIKLLKVNSFQSIKATTITVIKAIDLNFNSKKAIIITTKEYRKYHC